VFSAAWENLGDCSSRFGTNVWFPGLGGVEWGSYRKLLILCWFATAFRFGTLRVNKQAKEGSCETPKAVAAF